MFSVKHLVKFVYCCRLSQAGYLLVSNFASHHRLARGVAQLLTACRWAFGTCVSTYLQRFLTDSNQTK